MVILNFYSYQVKPYSVYVTCAVFNYNGTEVLGSYSDDDIYLFDTKHEDGSEYVHKYEGHRNSDTGNISNTNISNYYSS